MKYIENLVIKNLKFKGDSEEKSRTALELIETTALLCPTELHAWILLEVHTIWCSTSGYPIFLVYILEVQLLSTIV